MAKITDPQTFLTNLVSRRGKSDLFGVYLTGVNILADASEDYGYKVPEDGIRREVEKIFSECDNNWMRFLTKIRRNTENIIHQVTLNPGKSEDPITLFFLAEGSEVSLLAFIPNLVVEEFAREVCFYQRLLQEVAKFAGKTPTTIRFTLGVAYLDWEDMVEMGEAREVDVGF